MPDTSFPLFPQLLNGNELFLFDSLAFLVVVLEKQSLYTALKADYANR